MTYEELKKEMEKYPETMSEGERMKKYAAGETVDIGDLPLANKADDIILGKASLYLESSERVGTVQDDKLFA